MTFFNVAVKIPLGQLSFHIGVTGLKSWTLVRCQVKTRHASINFTISIKF